MTLTGQCAHRPIKIDLCFGQMAVNRLHVDLLFLHFWLAIKCPRCRLFVHQVEC